MTDKKQARTPNLKFIAPTATLVFPSFIEGDKFGKMGARVRFDAEAYEALLNEIEPQMDKGAKAYKSAHGSLPTGLQELHDAAIEKAREEFAQLKPAARKKLGDVSINEIGTPVFDDDENETGEFEVNFKVDAAGERKDGTRWTREPLPLVDAKGKPIKRSKVHNIWSGSTAKVCFIVNPDGYFIPGTGAAGIKLQPIAFQIIEARGPGAGPRDGASFGFGVEDGFDAAEVEDEDDDVPAPAQEEDDGNDASDF